MSSTASKSSLSNSNRSKLDLILDSVLDLGMTTFPRWTTISDYVQGPTKPGEDDLGWILSKSLRNFHDLPSTY